MRRFLRKTRPIQKSPARPRPLRLESLETRQVLASAYQNPGQIFDVNNDTYVDQEDVRLSEVRLATVGEGALPSTRNHPEIPFYDVNGDGSFTRQDLTALRGQIQNGRATTSIKLAHDSGNKVDRVTNDVRIAGRVMNFEPGARVFARFGDGRWSRVDITQLVRRDGSFELSIHDLHRINGRVFADGNQTFFVQSYTRQGRTSGVVDYSFTIDRAAPSAFNFEPKVVDPSVGTSPSTWRVRWSHVNATSYEIRVTSDPAGKNLVFYHKDIPGDQLDNYPISGVGAGTYYVFVTGFDESGNRVEANGSGQRVDWAPTFNPPIITPPANNEPVEPAVFGVQTIDGVTVPTWTIRWQSELMSSFHHSYTAIVSRDAAGTDVVLQYFTMDESHKWLSASHLPAGTYYVKVTEGVSHPTLETAVLCEGVRVDWNPSRPGEFSATTPSGYLIGNTMSLEWESSAGAVRYEVHLRDAEDYRAPHDFRYTGFQEQYQVISGGYPLRSTHSTTGTAITINGVAEGHYLVDIVAIDAAGRATLVQSMPRFFVDADGQIAPQIQISRIYKPVDLGGPPWTGEYETELHLSANFRSVTTDQVRFEFFSSPDLSEESRILTHTSDSNGIRIPFQSLGSAAHVYVRIKFLDEAGVSLTCPIFDFIPGDLEPYWPPHTNGGAG